MKTDEFLTEVGKRFDMKDVVLSDLKEYAVKLRPSSREKLFIALKKKHSYASIRNIGSVRKIAEGIGVKLVQDDVSYFLCDRCKTRFSTASRGCPICGIPLYQLNCSAGVAGKNSNLNIWKVREDCWDCRFYDKTDSDCQGPTCSVWGKWHHESASCRNCRCAKCCREQFLLNNDFPQFQKLDAEGKLEERTRMGA